MLKSYSGKPIVDDVVKFLTGETVQDLRYEQARRDWPFPYSADDVRRFFKKKLEIIKQEEEIFVSHLSRSASQYFNELGIDQEEKEFSGRFKFTGEETVAVLTKRMHREIPLTKGKDYLEIMNECKKHVANQKLLIVEYAVKIAIPMIKKMREENKFDKMVDDIINGKRQKLIL